MLEAYRRIFTQFLVQNWRYINQNAFGGVLEEPVFELLESKRKLGHWDSARAALGISTDLLLHRSEIEILETLKHEMAHQYADQVLKITQDPAAKPHGDAFRYACDRLGISHAAALKANAPATPILEKIRKLLALAESENLHEAQAAMARARQLMAKYELEVGLHDHHFAYRYLGKPRKQKSSVDNIVANILKRFFAVEVVWIPSRLIHVQRSVWLMEICGTNANLEIADYIYTYLKRELDLLWNGHRRHNPAQKGISLKREFQLGVLGGLSERLAGEEEPMPENSGTRELILLKQSKLENFYHDRHPNLRRTRSVTYRQSAAWHAGVEQGRRMDIRKGLKDKKGSRKRIGS